MVAFAGAHHAKGIDTRHARAAPRVVMLQTPIDLLLSDLRRGFERLSRGASIEDSHGAGDDDQTKELESVSHCVLSCGLSISQLRKESKLLNASRITTVDLCRDGVEAFNKNLLELRYNPRLLDHFIFAIFATEMSMTFFAAVCAMVHDASFAMETGTAPKPSKNRSGVVELLSHRETILSQPRRKSKIFRNFQHGEQGLCSKRSSSNKRMAGFASNSVFVCVITCHFFSLDNDFMSCVRAEDNFSFICTRKTGNHASNVRSETCLDFHLNPLSECALISFDNALSWRQIMEIEDLLPNPFPSVHVQESTMQSQVERMRLHLVADQDIPPHPLQFSA